MPRYTFAPQTIAEFEGYAEEYAQEAETPEEIAQAEQMKVDPNAFERTSNGNYSQYESATASFVPADLQEEARTVYEALRALDVHTLRVRYDGGGDEGFAHFASAQSNSSIYSLEEISEAMRQLTATIQPEEEIWELCEALSSRLLGERYGTGEYSLYGHFTVNLITGEITDEPTTVEDLPADADENYQDN